MQILDSQSQQKIVAFQSS